MLKQELWLCGSRLIFPNGTSISIDNMQGVDQAGYSGLHDKVKSHFGRVIWSALIGGAMTAGVATATDVKDSDSFRSKQALPLLTTFPVLLIRWLIKI